MALVKLSRSQTKTETKTKAQPEDGEGIHIEDVSLTQMWGGTRETRGGA